LTDKNKGKKGQKGQKAAFNQEVGTMGV